MENLEIVNLTVVKTDLAHRVQRITNYATATYVAFTSPEMLGLSLQNAIGWQTAALYLQIVDQTSAAQQAETRVQQYLLDFD